MRQKIDAQQTSVGKTFSVSSIFLLPKMVCARGALSLSISLTPSPTLSLSLYLSFPLSPHLSSDVCTYDSIYSCTRTRLFTVASCLSKNYTKRRQDSSNPCWGFYAHESRTPWNTIQNDRKKRRERTKRRAEKTIERRESSSLLPSMTTKQRPNSKMKILMRKEELNRMGKIRINGNITVGLIAHSRLQNKICFTKHGNISGACGITLLSTKKDGRKQKSRLSALMNQASAQETSAQTMKQHIVCMAMPSVGECV